MLRTNDVLFRQKPQLYVGSVTLDEQDNLQSQREKMARIILDHMYHFAGLLDKNGTILEINLPALDGAGQRIEELRGVPFWEARWFSLSRDSQAQQQEFVQRVAAGEFIRCDMEIYGEASGEATIIVDYSLTPVRDNDGEVIFLLAEGRNITEKKHIELEVSRKREELEQLVRQVQELDRGKSRFFSNLSHELRTPLSLILAPLDELLANPDGLPPRQLTDLASIRRNAVTLLRRVNELLDLAKLDARKMTLNYVRTDVGTLIEDVTSHFAAHAALHKISCVALVPEPITAELDADKVNQVIFNLLSNAFKATPDGGRISCSAQKIGGRLLLTVQDSGIGIAHSLRDKIFERFQQGDADGSQPGTGLGLAIVKEFVELHGGIVAVADSPGSGALFQVELPLFAPTEARVLQSPAPFRWRDPQVPESTELIDSAGTGADVLVVEDNPDMRQLISRVLGSEFHVRSATNGHQGLIAMQQRTPDLVITDLMMPQLSGDQMLHQMRALPALAQVPVLVLSARADEELRLSLLTDLAQDYVTKPFFIPELLSRARNLVMMRRARVALQNELETHNADLVQLAGELIQGRQALQRSLQARLKSEARWRAIYERSAIGIAVVDHQWRFLNTNPAFCQMLGYTSEELKGVSVLSLTDPQDRDVTDERLQSLLNGELFEYRYQKRFVHKNGHSLWTQSSVSLMPATGDGPPSLIGVVEDIDRRKLAEHALQQSREELARVMRVTTLGELAASITHEVNQPLAAIATNSNACRRWLEADPPNHLEAMHSLRSISRDSLRAAQVIVRIREFLKRGVRDVQPLKLAELVSQVLEFISEPLRMQDITLRVDVPDSLAYVSGDRIQLQQVILNLLLNSLESMQSCPRPHNLSILGRLASPDCVYLQVEDSGKGIAPDQRNQIFDAFYTTKEQGLGMGLAICRSIAEAHGGHLECLAEPPQGVSTALRLNLPTALEVSR
jgi:PAS domain S-box-containing protein